MSDLSNDLELRRVQALMHAHDQEAVFVFGSNTAGKHGGGAARTAWANYGAQWGIGEGPTGRSYAIPTMAYLGDDDRFAAEQLPLTEVARAVAEFIEHATRSPDTTFAVTRIGCGIAGFS